MDLYYDNSGAIAQAKEPMNHHKVRHIDRKYHLIRKIVKNGDVELCKIHTDANVAYPLTKPLPQPNPSMRGTLEIWAFYVYLIDSSASGRLLEICPRGNHV